MRTHNFSVLAIWILACCSLTFAQDNPNKLRIGMLLPLSGQYAAIGADNQQGVEVAKLEISNGDRFEFIFSDSRAEPAQAVSEFRRLSTVENIHGAYVFRGPPGMAVNPLSKSARLPLLGGVGNKDFALGNEYAFQLWIRSDEEGAFLASKLFDSGYKKVALFTVQDDWPVAVSNGFRERAKSLGITLVLDNEILPSDSDFRSHLLKLRDSEIDAVFINVGLGQIGPLAKQIKDLGIKAPLYSNFWAGKKEVISAAGEAGNGLMFAEMATDLGNLKSELNTRFKSTPSGATLSAYVATILFSQALTDIGDSKVSANALYESLLKQKEVKTRNGIFEIKERFVQFPMTMRTISSGSVQ